MAHLELVMFAQSVTVDREKNTLSIFHVLDGLDVPAAVPEPPSGQAVAVGPPIVVIMFWRRSKMLVPETAAGRIRLLGPRSRTQFGSSDFKVDLGGNSRRSQATLNIPFVPYQGPGEYHVVVDLKVGDDKWKRIGNREFIVTKLR